MVHSGALCNVPGLPSEQATVLSTKYVVPAAAALILLSPSSEQIKTSAISADPTRTCTVRADLVLARLMERTIVDMLPSHE
jgi:hypothetical protein